MPQSDAVSPRSHRIAGLRLALLCILISAAAFWVPLSRPGLTPGYDWHYFASLDLVARSGVLQYGVPPLHDPWGGGGFDYLANPQNRVFSPLFLLDLILPPYHSDLFALFLQGCLGAAGLYALSRRLGHSKRSSLVGAFLFVNCGWFGLHFAEGHIAYGSMQLLPWVLFFGFRLDSPAGLFGVLSLLSYFLLSGGIYSAVFSFLLLAMGALFGKVPWLGLFAPRSRRDTLLLLLSLASCFLLVCPKILPVIYLNGDLPGQRESMNLTLIELGRIFFWPLQKQSEILSLQYFYRFHEFGCYIGLPALLLILSRLRRRDFRSKNLWLPVSTLFFFWTGSGWGGVLNPWRLFQLIPLVNIAHVQSRVFVLLYLCVAMLLITALDRVRRPGWWWAVASLLCMESLFVRSHIFLSAFDAAKPRPAEALIRSTTIRETVEYGYHPFHYLSGDRGARIVYEASAQPTGVRASVEPEYRGEIYFREGTGSVALDRYTPGRITFSYQTAGPALIELNTNFLGGWRPDSGEIQVEETDRGLVGVRLSRGTGVIQLRYAPPYWPFVWIAYACGLILWGGTLIELGGKARRKSETAA